MNVSFSRFLGDMIVEHRNLLFELLGECESITELAELIMDTYHRDGLILTCGNGGSASTAEHFACDLAKTTGWNMRAVAMTSAPIISAIANDRDAKDIFADQVIQLGRRGDLLIIISSSGNSKDLVVAAEEACLRGIRVAAIVGHLDCELSDHCNPLVSVNSLDYKHNEPLADLVCHAITFYIKSLDHRHRQE